MTRRSLTWVRTNDEKEREKRGRKEKQIK